MSPLLPPGFLDISTALSSQGIKSVIGVVVDALSKTRSGGSSYVVTFTLKDTDFNGDTWNGLKIKYFNDDDRLLPPIEIYDVVLLRNIRVRLYQGKTVGVASQHDQVLWTIFRRDRYTGLGSVPIRSPGGGAPSEAEQTYAHTLLNRITSLTDEYPATETPPVGIRQRISARPAVAIQESNTVVQSVRTEGTKALPKKRPVIQLRDAKTSTFVDFVCQVVKTWDDGYGRYTLHVTDYTTNELFLDNGDGSARDGDDYAYLRPNKNRTGPMGKMTMTVTLWEPHASYARQNLKVNDFILLTNVHIKLPKNRSILEGIIHTDRSYPEKLYIQPVDQTDDMPQLQELLRRKKEYWQKHGDRNAGGDGNSKSRARKRKQERAAEAQRKKQQQTPKKEEGQTALRIPRPAGRSNQPNPHVQASDPARRGRSIDDILDNESHENTSPDGVQYRLPFQNLCYRPTVRIVDYFPHYIEDFAVPKDDEDASSTTTTTSSDSDDNRRWEWRFCLLVENAAPAAPGHTKARMKLFVSGNDAVYLLGIDPCDLRRNEVALAALKEKLFILWGDFEEKKLEFLAQNPPHSDSDSYVQINSVSSMPFTCCVKEYGVRCSHEKRGKGGSDELDTDDYSSGPVCEQDGCFGWERRFAMFGTVIQS